MKRGNSVEGGANASRFTDLEDPTFFFMISWADSQGIIKGTSATTFEPKGSITLQDAYTIIVRALGYEKEESLPYPFGYIGVAENKGVELDEGLSSDVSYTDALTRGDVAILLYNAFFAETGVAETKQVERELSDGSIVLETKTDYPTLAEKVYDVIEVEYRQLLLRSTHSAKKPKPPATSATTQSSSIKLTVRIPIPLTLRLSSTLTLRTSLSTVLLTTTSWVTSTCS